MIPRSLRAEAKSSGTAKRPAVNGTNTSPTVLSGETFRLPGSGGEEVRAVISFIAY